MAPGFGLVHGNPGACEQRPCPVLHLLEGVLLRRRCRPLHGAAPVLAGRRGVHGRLQYFQRRDFHHGALAARSGPLSAGILGRHCRTCAPRDCRHHLCRAPVQLPALPVPGGYSAVHPAVLRLADIDPGGGRDSVQRRRVDGILGYERTGLCHPPGPGSDAERNAARHLAVLCPVDGFAVRARIGARGGGNRRRLRRERAPAPEHPAGADRCASENNRGHDRRRSRQGCDPVRRHCRLHADVRPAGAGPACQPPERCLQCHRCSRGEARCGEDQDDRGRLHGGCRPAACRSRSRRYDCQAGARHGRGDIGLQGSGHA